MEIKEKCRVCGAENKIYRDFIDVGVGYGQLCEELINCHSCGYFYLFTYGNYHEGFDGICDFQWSYDTSENDIFEIQQKLDEVKRTKEREYHAD